MIIIIISLSLSLSLSLSPPRPMIEGALLQPPPTNTSALLLFFLRIALYLLRMIYRTYWEPSQSDVFFADRVTNVEPQHPVCCRGNSPAGVLESDAFGMPWIFHWRCAVPHSPVPIPGPT